MSYANALFPLFTKLVDGSPAIVLGITADLNRVHGRYFHPMGQHWVAAQWHLSGDSIKNPDRSLPPLAPPTLFELLETLPQNPASDSTIADMVRRAVRSRDNDYAPALQPIYAALKEKLNAD